MIMHRFTNLFSCAYLSKSTFKINSNLVGHFHFPILLFRLKMDDDDHIVLEENIIIEEEEESMHAVSHTTAMACWWLQKVNVLTLCLSVRVYAHP